MHFVGLGDSIIRALEKHNKSSSIYKEKVYILVPFSCDCKDKLSDADDNISYLDTIHPIYVDHSGNSRKYSFDMYTFFDKNEVSTSYWCIKWVQQYMTLYRKSIAKCEQIVLIDCKSNNLSIFNLFMKPLKQLTVNLSRQFYMKLLSLTHLGQHTYVNICLLL